MFLGAYPLRLDEKGRLFLPVKWRPQLAEGLVITKGQERCLQVFPQAEFARMSQTLSNSSMTAKTLRDFARVFFSSGSDEVPDRQGRVTVPRELREYADLDRECMVIGANTRAEIWATTAWEQYLVGSESSFAELSEELMPGL